jgi:hypothetical protein
MAWNYHQTALLREQHGKIPSVAIASLLGKSPNAIIEKANKMGLSSNLYHTVEVQLYSVINCRDEDYCAPDIPKMNCVHSTQKINFALSQTTNLRHLL